MNTLLTDPNPPEVQAALDAIDAERERLRFIVLGIWLEGYKEGRLTLEETCRRAGKVVANLGEGHRERILGQLLDRALRVTPAVVKARRKGEPTVQRDACLGMLDLIIKHEGLRPTASRDLAPTIFERGSAILAEIGIDVSPSRLKRWYYGTK